jgi:GT2 family glycosyltransferase
LRFEEDLGGAGSFHYGLKYAYEAGYKKFILCDNDFVPAINDAVQRIVDNLDEVDVVAPKTGSKEICFYHFVGITRKVVARVGYPRKEFFMWVDELEYSWRVKRTGFTERRIEIPFRHPTKAVFLDDPRAIYYCTRNSLYLFLDYKNIENL